MKTEFKESPFTDTQSVMVIGDDTKNEVRICTVSGMMTKWKEWKTDLIEESEVAELLDTDNIVICESNRYWTPCKTVSPAAILRLSSDINGNPVWCIQLLEHMEEDEESSEEVLECLDYEIEDNVVTGLKLAKFKILNSDDTKVNFNNRDFLTAFSLYQELTNSYLTKKLKGNSAVEN